MPTYTATPGTAAIVSNGGDTWDNPNNATGASDTNTADVITYSNESNPDNLELSNFGFSVPGTEEIVGIEVVMRARDDVALNPAQLRAFINTALDGVGGGKSENAGTTGALNETLTDYTLGGPTDDHGETWLPSEVNSSNFNITINPRLFSGLTTSVFLDSVTVNIYTDLGAVAVWTDFIQSEEILNP